LQAIGIGRHGDGQHFDRHVAAEPRVACPIDLAHAAGAERADDFVRAELRAAVESHLVDECAIIPTGEHTTPARRAANDFLTSVV